MNPLLVSRACPVFQTAENFLLPGNLNTPFPPPEPRRAAGYFQASRSPPAGCRAFQLVLARRVDPVPPLPDLGKPRCIDASFLPICLF